MSELSPIAKTCKVCGLLKPLTDFYKHKQCADGHIGECKSCSNAKSNAYRKTPSGRASVRKYQQTDAYKARRAEFMATDAWKDSQARGGKKFRERNPKQYKANTKFTNAVRLGKIMRQPCFVCGAGEAEGHHPDYDAPLDVVWLCRPHHLEVHLMALRNNLWNG